VIRGPRDILKKLYGKGPQERSDTIGLLSLCLALRGCFLCLIVVLSGIFYTGIFHPNEKTCSSPQIVLEDDTISLDNGTHACLTVSTLVFFPSAICFCLSIGDL